MSSPVKWIGNNFDDLLFEFRSILKSLELNSDGSAVFNNDHTEYWMLIELKFVLRSIKVAAQRNLQSALLIGHANGSLNVHTADDCKIKLNEATQLLEYIEKEEKVRLQATASLGYPAPRISRLAEAYKLGRAGTEVFQLLVLLFTSKTNAFRLQVNNYSEEQDMFMEICSISKLDLTNLYLDENQYVKDGVLLVDTNFNDEKCPRVSREVALAMTGGKLSASDKLKLAGTEALAIVVQDGGEDASMNVVISNDEDENKEETEIETELSREGKRSRHSFDVTNDGIDSELEALMNEDARRDDSAKRAKVISDDLAEESDKDQKPYETSLDFLDDYFQLITEQVKLSRERLKREMKEVVGDDDVAPWARDGKGRRANMRQFEAKIRMVEAKIAARLEYTEKLGLTLPRLHLLCQRLQLDEFERKVVVLLIGHTVSPMMKEFLDSLAQNGLQGRYSSSDHVTVKLLLHTFCSTFQDQVANRAYFYKSSRLLGRGVIKMPLSNHARLADIDLMHQAVILDRRILDWVVGLDTEISEIVEGSNLYQPTVDLEDVVLEENQKKEILSSVMSFQAFKKYQKKHSTEASATPHFSSTFARGLVLLFSGPSGTGKTMTANALAKHLKMKVLLVNFNTMVEGQSSKGGGSMQSLFREADIHNAVLFFDECESLFAQRGHGGSAQLTELLTDIERHKGIIFLATNRPYDLDEAMHRRITSAFEFKPPNHLQRERIWETHTSKAGVPLADGIDWAEISIRYELAGGYIKNAVLSALLLSISRDGADNPKITHTDIVDGCAHQMRGTLKMKSFSDRVVPTTGLDSLVFSERTRQELHDVINLEKARGILFGQWGFGEKMRAQQSTTVLLSGPHGCGKRSAAEAIGYDTGRPLKVMSYSRLMSKSSSRSDAEDSIIKAVFKDASLMNAIVVLHGFEIELLGKEVSTASTLAFTELMDEIERYNGAVIVLVSTSTDLSMYIHRLDPTFVRKFKFLISISMPKADDRKLLWERLIPAKVPRESDIDFQDLAQRYELSGGQISRVAYRAAALAALRPRGFQILKIDDLNHAARMEEEKVKGEVSKMVQQWFA